MISLAKLCFSLCVNLVFEFCKNDLQIIVFWLRTYDQKLSVILKIQFYEVFLFRHLYRLKRQMYWCENYSEISALIVIVTSTCPLEKQSIRVCKILHPWYLWQSFQFQYMGRATKVFLNSGICQQFYWECSNNSQWYEAMVSKWLTPIVISIKSNSHTRNKISQLFAYATKLLIQVF